MRVEDGLVIFVTGGASGLGKATVLYLHRKGAKCAVADMDMDALQELEAKLKTRILVLKCDVTVENEV